MQSVALTTGHQGSRCDRREPRSFSSDGEPVPIVSTPGCHGENQARLEAGGLLLVPDRPFDIADARDFLFADFEAITAKAISFSPRSGALKGGRLPAEAQAGLAEVIGRYALWAKQLVTDLLPAYASALEWGQASYRPRPASDAISPRRDDRRLHIDAFPSQPVQGRRILRVFRNVHPAREERIWRIGEPFKAHAARFLPATRPAPPGQAAVLRALGVTKGRRTAYDALMLQLHDAAKADEAYQAEGGRHLVRFPEGATWLVFSDAVVHAAVKGQFAFEQTFFLPVQAMADSATSPLRILEAATGRRLT